MENDWCWGAVRWILVLKYETILGLNLFWMRFLNNFMRFEIRNYDLQMAIKLKLGRKEDFVNLLEFLLYFMMATFSYFLIYSGNRCAEIFNCDHFPKLFFVCTKFSKERDFYKLWKVVWKMYILKWFNIFQFCFPSILSPYWPL